MKRTNLKVYQGKDRIYPKVSGTTGIHRILVWDADRNEYVPPKRGLLFYARRYELDEFGVSRRRLEYFGTLDEARAWQSFRVEANQVVSTVVASSSPKTPEKPGGPLLRDVIHEWRARKYPSLAVGSTVHYDQLLQLHFSDLMPLPVNKITPQVIDAWLAKLKAGIGKTYQSRSRTSFDHELALLTVLLRYYDEYADDPHFRLPLKKRHRQDSKLKVSLPIKPKDLSLAEFFRFRAELEKGKYGKVLAPLTTLQFFEALRISEGAGVYWEDVRLEFSDPKESRIFIVRSVEFSRKKGMETKVTPGFKNSKALGGTKELPMFPETFEALKKIYYIGAKGLIFHDDHGQVFSYSFIRNAYDRAFKKAGLPYTATHVMRHGGTRDNLNSTGGDFTIAGQLLGNSDMETIQTYAKRHKGALTKVSHEQWKRHDEKNSALAANGRKSGSAVEGV